MYARWGKRTLDILLSVFILVLLGIPMLILALLVKLDSKGPVIFKQERIGKDGRVFHIYKFRSMCVGAEKTGSGVYSGKGDARVTRVGRFLRASSADELPQVINILRGDMSFIGPRPVVLTEKRLINQRARNGADRVKPGMTGLSQVSGRDDLPIYKKARLDAFYAHNMTFMGDLAILQRTISCVLRAEGVRDGAKPKETVSKTANRRRTA